MITSTHKKLHISGDYKMIVISDIHGHLDRFKQLLEKVNYNPKEDYLIILGDFVEKGEQSLETLNYVQQLSQNKRCYVLLGNCEWALTALLEVEEFANEIPRYFSRVPKNGMVRDAYRKLNIDTHNENWLSIQKRIRDYLKDALQFISTLPLTLKINEELLFVHAGIDKVNYQNCKLSTLLEMQDFYYQGHNLDLDVIVGHIPASNYRNALDNRILINRKEKIICIDGGTGVKPISQLNALIITKTNGKITYQSNYIRTLPKYKVTCDVEVHQKSFSKICYPNFEIKIIQRGKQFSECIRVTDQSPITIKNEFIIVKNQHIYCLDDYTSYMHHASKNQTIELLGVYGEYMYGIINNKVGWIHLSNTNYEE